MLGYHRRLERDLKRWQDLGLIDSALAGRLSADAARAGTGFALAPILAILASVLLGFAVISFVAAHWTELSRLTRLAVLIGSMGIAYAVAGMFYARAHAKFADAAVLLAVAVFGASIMLISQMFHIDGHAPDAVLVWWIGAFATGIVLRSNPALAFAMVLVAVWAMMETSITGDVHWPFLIGWALIAAAFAWQRWAPGVHIAGLALAGFVISIGYSVWRGHGHGVVVAIGLIATFGSMVLAMRPVRIGDWDLNAGAQASLGYSAATAFFGLMAMQFVESPGFDHLVLLAGLTLALLVGLIWYGVATGNRGALWLGYIGFSVEILAVYFNLVGTLLSTSAFFVTAGLLVLALAGLAWRLNAGERSIEVAP
ncbi:MAG: DUF2157 domain-containing protein [Hyphomicrobium sp.]